MALVLRRNKSAPLTYEEMDGNFEELEGSVNGILSEAEVRALISVTDNGGDGALFYNSTTGVITYTGPSATEARAHFSAGNGIGITDGVVSVTVDGINDTMLDFGTGANQINTDDLPEGSTNQYYTDARADARIALASIDVLTDVDARPAVQGDVLTYSSVDDGYIPVAPPGATGGEANDGFNTGTGAGIFKQKIGVDLEFKSLVAGSSIGITENANDLTINFLPTGDVDVNTQKIINVTDPVLAQDAATKAYVDSTIASSDLDFAGDTGTGAVDLGSQTFTIFGTANEIETVASGQTITIGLPSNITTDVTGNVSGTAATVTEAAQANITSLGTLTSLTMGGDIALGTNKITGLGDPVNNQDAATKTYVDTIAAAGLHYHTPVRVEKEGNLNVTYDNGTDGVGATLTNSGTQAALVIDGITMVVADRVLVYEQTDATQNGVYTVTDIGSASTNWVLTRATDADSYGASEKDSLGEGDAFYVLEGAVGAGELYVMNTIGAITFGTTDITFAQISSAQIYSVSTGLDLTGVTFSLSHLGIQDLTDPGADRIAFWDDSASTFEWLTVGSGLVLDGTTLSTSAAAEYTGGDGIDLTGLDFSVDLTDTATFTSANTVSKAVVRDSSGDFGAGTITASLAGNVTGDLTGDVTSTGTSVFSTVDINGGAIDGTAIGANAPSTGAFTTINASGAITGNVSGNASTATALETARNIGGVSFDGTENIDLPGVNTAGNQSTSGNAGTATALETSRNIGGVAFDGTASIDLPGVNTAGNQNTSGNAASATQLETSRNIGGVSFNGTANIDLPGVNTAGNQDTSGTAAVATQVTVSESFNVNATSYIPFVGGETGNRSLVTDVSLSYNASTNTLNAGIFNGTATQAQYADLAEIYTTDSEYSFGTVVKLGGEAEITQTTQCCDTQVFGVISEHPAYLMNSTETGLPVALSGRISVKLIGAVSKGQRIVSSAIPGVAEAIDDADINNVLAIIGRALESNDNVDEKLVECVVGKL